MKTKMCSLEERIRQSQGVSVHVLLVNTSHSNSVGENFHCYNVFTQTHLLTIIKSYHYMTKVCSY